MKLQIGKKSRQTSLLAVQVVLPTVAFFLMVLVLIGILGLKFYSHHLRQAQMLNYVEFEQISETIGRSWKRIVELETFTGEGLSVLNWTEKGLSAVQGEVADIPLWETMKPSRSPSAPFAIEVLGKNYLAKIEVDSGDIGQQSADQKESFSAKVILKPLDISQLLDSKKVPLESSLLYLVSQEGQLIFSTSSSIGQKNFSARPIVQKFILNQVDASGNAFVDSNNQEGFGYSFTISDTNLVMFAEVSPTGQNKAFAPLLKQAVGIGLSATLLVALLAYVIHRRLYRHLKELAYAMEKTSLSPQSSELRPTNISEIAFIKQAWKSSEDKMAHLYHLLDKQRLSSQEANLDLKKAGANDGQT